MITSAELVVLYKMKDKTNLAKHLVRFEFEIADLNHWFNEYLDSYTNAVMMDATYESEIRKPYNEKYEQYEHSIELARMCKYYLEKL